MSIMSLIIVVLSLSGTFVNAWDPDERCHDLGKYRHLEGGNFQGKSLDDRDLAVATTLRTHHQLEGGHSRERPQGESDKGVVSTVDTHLQLRSDSTKQSLRGYDQRNLQLFTFQMKLHWEQEYCWQAEWNERKWCMTCYGGKCDKEEVIWIQECNDAIIQRFVWEPVEVPGRVKSGKLKPYTRQDLCLENIGAQGNYSYFNVDNPNWWNFLLRPCDPGNILTQILDGYDSANPFRLVSRNSSETRPDRCVTMAHHPRAGEELIGEFCEIACDRDDTCLWDAYNAHSKLPATPNVDTSEFCAPQGLMKTNDVVQEGNPLINWDADTYVEQYNNGRFVVRRGYPDRPGDIVFDSGVDRSEGDYFTKLQHDGNLITFKGTPDDKDGDSVWKTNSNGAIAQYFLGIECDLKTISIYEYVPEDPGKLMWTTGKYPSPTPDLKPEPTPAPVTAVPSSSATSSAADLSLVPTPAAVTAVPSSSATSSGVEAPTPAPVTAVPSSSATSSAADLTLVPTPDAETAVPSSSATSPPTTGVAAGGLDLPQLVAMSGSFCKPDAKCPHCYGDCDTDEDCEGNLKCFQRDGGEEVPSCSGGETKKSDTDFCYDPTWKAV